MDIYAVNNFGDTRSGGLAGPMGLLVIVLMCIATVLLIRNMNKRLRRLPDSFPDPAQTQREAEIARLNADLQGPDAGPGHPDVDDRRSTTAPTDEDGEVSGAGPTDDGRSGGAGSARP